MRLFGNGTDVIAQQALVVANQGLTKIDQHMHDCELRARSVETRLDKQDRQSDERHTQNSGRLDRLDARFTDFGEKTKTRFIISLTSLILLLIGGMGTLALELIKALK